MTPTDFSPPVDCQFCRRIADAGEFGRCHGCTQAEHKHDLQAFGIALHGFVAKWASVPEESLQPLERHGVIGTDEATLLREQLGILYALAESITGGISRAIATDIANDAYASGHRFSIDGRSEIEDAQENDSETEF